MTRAHIGWTSGSLCTERRHERECFRDDVERQRLFNRDGDNGSRLLGSGPAPEMEEGSTREVPVGGHLDRGYAPGIVRSGCARLIDEAALERREGVARSEFWAATFPRLILIVADVSGGTTSCPEWELFNPRKRELFGPN